MFRALSFALLGDVPMRRIKQRLQIGNGAAKPAGSFSLLVVDAFPQQTIYKQQCAWNEQH